MNNRPDAREGVSRRVSELDPSALPDGTAFRPISVTEGTGLRDEAVLVRTENGHRAPLDTFESVPDGAELQARSVYRVLNAWRDWFDGYRNAHIEYEDPDGKTVRTPLENSYQPEYGKRYYAKIKDWERGIERAYQAPTMVMVTLSASSENAKGGRRCPADHMRDIARGWNSARKALHRVLRRFEWEYAKVWEPHQSGYGHMHVAVAVDDPADEIEGETFRPVVRSHVENVEPAGSAAHGLNAVGMGDTVSVNREVENLGSYISEYIGIFGEEPTERPVSEQMFYATCWATGTRRVDFSNGAHEIMAMEQFRRETGLRPEDRGGDTFDQWRDGATGETDADGSSGGSWSVDSICTVTNGTPTYSDPTAGGQRLTPIDGRAGVDPPAHRD
uniref:Replication-related protein n=1 Tax=Natronobacterium sp. AS-7091 TaxID=198929 RepID=Q7ZA98_9EURY|nr:replication-related protein [Natronobacterium sp. AS-7091]AAQ05763.1 replication-related protein [Natronobacterium sp. AS-7091]